ncbi:transposase [Neisseria meningitidis]|nr:transposase [Neisseria meningitidis]
MKPMKLRLHLNFENRHNLLCNPFEHSGIKAGGFYILTYSGLTKIRTGDVAAASTNSTEPIHSGFSILENRSL